VAEDSNCWWQINLNAHPQYDGARLRSDPAYCAQAALEVWQGAGWDAWSTYKNGSYLAFVDAAQQPVAPPAPAPPPVVAGDIGGIPPTPASSRPWLVLGAAALALWAVGEL
jgi:hypothetical protein